MSVKKENNDLEEEALFILKDAFRKVMCQEEDFNLKDEIKESFIAEIFFQAWENQFSDDSTKFKKSVRKIIRDMTKSADENQ